MTLPENLSGMPQLWWTSDPSPARTEQIGAFEQWVADKGFGQLDLKLDNNSSGSGPGSGAGRVLKVVIQSSCGVGSDIVDVYSRAELRHYVDAGVLCDVTDLAQERGFGPEKTYACIRDEICIDDRQYAFPCSMTAFPILFNKSLLEREGLPLPKFDWTWEEFLKWSLAIKKVDENGVVQRYAFWPLDDYEIWRFWAPAGGTIFNETMTACTIDSPAIHEATKFYYDLMFVHKVIPTPLEKKAAAAQSGHGGITIQWLADGYIAAARY